MGEKWGYYTPACTGFTHKRLGGYAKQVFAHKSIGFWGALSEQLPLQFQKIYGFCYPNTTNWPLETIGIGCVALVCGNTKATAGDEFAAATAPPDTLQLSPRRVQVGRITHPPPMFCPCSAGLAVSNSVPEVKRSYPGKGSFGTANVAFGVLPGLELRAD